MSDPAPWSVERIRRDHVREHFDCGNPDLDGFLKKYARQNDARDLGRTFVAVRKGELVVRGYYTLRSGSVETAILPEEQRKRLPRYPVPVAHLGRLAVDATVGGQGLGELLLVDALRRAHAASREAAAYAVEVVAVDAGARRFYEHYGFRAFAGDPLHLDLAMKTVEKLVARG